MEDEHRKAIQNNFISLVEQTDLDIMVTALYEKGVFSEQMIEPYKECKDLLLKQSLPSNPLIRGIGANKQDTNKDTRYRKRLIYMDITRRGPQAFGHLLDALLEAGYWDLVRDLDPNSSLHARRHRNPIPSTSTESNYVSISTEKKKTKTGSDVNKNIPPITRPPETFRSDVTDLMSPNKIPHFHVVKSTKFFDDNNKDIRLYRTRGRKRGVLVVFSYIEFNNIESYRYGVDVDCDNLKYLFDEFGFKVLSYKDLTKTQTLETLKGLKEVVTGAECVFIVVSSHGHERPNSSDNDVRCHEGGLISIYEILEHFNNKNFPGLRGVPKVFIFQLCRGSNEDFLEHRFTDGSNNICRRAAVDGMARAALAANVCPPAQLHPPPEPEHQRKKDRLYSDILIAHSTLPGNVSYRDGEEGSWYIQALCEVFASRAHDCHVEKLFTLVDMKLQDTFGIQTSSVDRWGFNSRLYLHPGLYENDEE